MGLTGLDAGTTWRAALRFLRPADDAFADFREKIATQIFRISAALLAPFGVFHLLHKQFVHATVILGTVIILVGHCLALEKRRKPLVPISVIAIALCGIAGAIITIQGTTAVPWIFPTLFAFFFILPRRQAMLTALLLTVVVTSATVVAVGWPLAARMAGAMSLVLLMIVVVLNIIGELQHALVAQAITDPLTGAFNRRHFDTQLSQLPTPSTAGADGVNVLLAMDLDHFKLVNDTYGHAVGDAVLRGAVAVICNRKRPTDQLFRTGGEEFMLLLQRTRLDDAAKMADELRRHIETASLLQDRTVTISVGVSAERVGVDRATWMRAADDALYRAKNSGRNMVCVAG